MTVHDGRLHGLMPAVLAPFDTAGRLQMEWLPQLLEAHRTAGVNGIVVCGTNGEGPSLSVTERKLLLECAVAHRGDLRIVAGTGAASLEDTLDLTRHAAAVGADAALLLPPFFFKRPTDEGLTSFFRTVLDAVNIPALLYHIPQFTSVRIPAAVITALAGHERLLGVKDSGGDWEHTRSLIVNYPDLLIFAGDDYLAARAYAAGAAGCISGGANPFPEISVAVRDAAASGDSARLEEAQATLDRMLDVLVRYPFVAAAKSVLAHRGLARMGVRPPLVNLTAEQETAMLSEFAAAGIHASPLL